MLKIICDRVKVEDIMYTNFERFKDIETPRCALCFKKDREDSVESPGGDRAVLPELEKQTEYEREIEGEYLPYNANDAEFFLYLLIIFINLLQMKKEKENSYMNFFEDHFVFCGCNLYFCSRCQLTIHKFY